MTRDATKAERIREALGAAQLDAVVCALPSNVLLLSGYWSIIGTTIAVATQDGRVCIIVPEDELQLAERGCADEVRAFRPTGIDSLRPVFENARAPLDETFHDLGLARGRIGYEHGAASVPASYASMYLYGVSLIETLSDMFPAAAFAPANQLLVELGTIKTPREIERIRAGCRIAARAYLEGARQLRPGLSETEAAALFRTPLSTSATDGEDFTRADGFVACVSGLNTAQAHGAYARSCAGKRIAPADFMLVHCNSYLDGYWTDITRTYYFDEPDNLKASMYEAVFEARRVAFDLIRPGVKAADVDSAVRETIKAHGYGGQFKHSTGHGVGFVAINADARPMLHPKSKDVLEVGMIFNVEPSIYVDGYGGLRHCDMVAVTEEGAELLTPFHSGIEQLMIVSEAAK